MGAQLFINIIIVLILLFIYILLSYFLASRLDRCFKNWLVEIVVVTSAEIVLSLLFIYLCCQISPLRKAVFTAFIPTPPPSMGGLSAAYILFCFAPCVCAWRRIDRFFRDRFKKKNPYVDVDDNKVSFFSALIIGFLVLVLTVVLVAKLALPPDVILYIR